MGATDVSGPPPRFQPPGPIGVNGPLPKAQPPVRIDVRGPPPRFQPPIPHRPSEGTIVWALAPAAGTTSAASVPSSAAAFRPNPGRCVIACLLRSSGLCPGRSARSAHAVKEGLRPTTHGYPLGRPVLVPQGTRGL